MPSIRPAFAVISLALALPALGAGPSREIAPRTLALAADGTLSIETYKGTVKVATWDKAEVLIKARIEADDESCRDRRHPAEAVEKTRVNVESGGSRVRVESDYSDVPSAWHWFGACKAWPFVHYEISMPRTASLRLKDYKSDSRLGDLAGDADIETYKGAVRVDRLDGGLRAETYKGDIRVVMAGVRRGLRAQTYKGKIEIAAPRAAAFTLDARAERGEVDARGFGLTPPAKPHGSRGQVAYGLVNGGGPTVRMETHKGTVRLTAF